MPANKQWMVLAAALSSSVFLPACESDTGISTRSPTCGNEGQVCCAGIGCYDGWTCTQGICRGAAGCTPSAEVCDGRDNDCNAQVDDGAATADCVARMGPNHVCKAGACACTDTCGGACVDLSRDPANCGACGKACAAGQSCTGGTCAMVTMRKWVINAITLPTTRQQFSIDLDGDGKPDNAFANIINVLGSQMLYAQDAVTAGIRGGTALHLLALGTRDANAMNDPAATTSMAPAVAQPMPDLSGSGMFTVDKNQPASNFTGGLMGGAFSSANPVTTKAPVSAVLALALFSDGGQVPQPMLLPINGAHIQYQVAGNALMTGALQGSIKATDLQRVVLPQLAASLTRTVMANPNGATAKSIIDLFDTGGCVDANGVTAMKGDKVITACELGNSDLIKNLLSPDIQVFDASGNYAPTPASRTPDSLSIAVSFTAVAASF